MQLEAPHQVMGEYGKLQPGAIGSVVIGGDHVEGKFPLEFGEGLFLRAAVLSIARSCLQGLSRSQRLLPAASISEMVRCAGKGPAFARNFVLCRHRLPS